MERRSLFHRWPTGAILLLLLTAALLPLGLVLAWVTQQSLRETNTALVERADQQGTAAFQAIEGLLARNALALRVAANGALESGAADPCEAAARTLAIAPAVARQFRIRDPNGRTVCSHGQYRPERDDLLVAPGDVKLWVSPQRLLVYRVGLIGGNATGVLTVDEIRPAAEDATSGVKQLTIDDGATTLPVIASPVTQQLRQQARDRRYDLAGGQVQLRTITAIERTTLIDMIVMLLPLLMWVAATLLSWLLVRRLLLSPLARLQRAVIEYQPDAGGLDLPGKYGVASEIEDLSNAFGRAVGRIEGAEREALDRVKNNLQVVASLLSIHGRSATKPEAKAAYSAIGRRVDALSVVHRHHYAELEENRGIALRPLLTELAADLRSSAPVEARGMRIELDLDAPSTTQDVVVATESPTTEIVEFAMLRHPEDTVEISLRREGELIATLAIASSVLVPEGDPGDIAKNQFERIVEGLARQLRSPLDRKLGRYTVTLPVFPND